MSAGTIVKWIVGLAALGGLGVGGYRYFNREQAPAAYDTVAVARGEVVQAVTASGTLKPVINVQVGSQISGIIQKLNADFNSRVKAGDLIAQLDAATYKANVSSAEANVASARANLELAQANARRDEALFNDKLLARFAYEQTMVNLHLAEAQVKVSEAALERANVDLARCSIYAPVDGVVITRNVDVGQTVAASLSAPVLFEIANDLRQMQINASVAEADVGTVLDAQEVEFVVDAYPYRTFKGQVTQVRNSPIVVQNVVTYDTIIQVNNDDERLKPGMTANVSIIIERRSDALLVPNAALRFRPPEVIAAESATNTTTGATQASGASSGGRQGGRRGGGGGSAGSRSQGNRAIMRTVYVLPANSAAKPTPGETKAKPVQVRVGITDGLVTEVLEGLNEGDTVATGLSSTTKTAATQGAPTTNPFGTGGGRGGRGF